jgi:hypothetical protein
VLLRHARTSLLLTLTLVAVAAALAATPAYAAPFADTAGASYDDAVTALASEGVVLGCGAGEFCPQDELTRGQFASMLVRALDLPASDVGPFGDTGDSVHAASIDRLAATGIVQGCANDAFCPEDHVTRGQMASMIARAFGLPEATERHFDDGDGAHSDAVDRLAEAGITAGCSSSLVSFCPHDAIVRWQAAVFVARSMGLADPVQLAPLADRRADQEAIDAAARARALEEEERRQAATASSRERIWDDLARCESGGNWSINTGNGYYGGLQFSLASWRYVGGTGYPHQHSRAEQIVRGERLLQRQGWGAWPACSRKLGYR